MGLIGSGCLLGHYFMVWELYKLKYFYQDWVVQCSLSDLSTYSFLDYTVGSSNWYVTFSINIACVASISNRVIARKLERKQKKRLKGEGEGEGRRGNACPQTPQFWKTPLDISRFGSFVNWQLVKIET